MPRLSITKFNQLENIDIEITNLIVFIGPQASGKSTISKTVFFFKSLKNNLKDYFIDCVEKNINENVLEKLTKIIRKKISGFWGSAEYFNEIHIKYFYSNDIYITIKKELALNCFFSSNFEKKIKSLENDIAEFLSKITQQYSTYTSSKKYLAIREEKKRFYITIEQTLADIFSDNTDHLFIPAGRSLISMLSEQLSSVHIDKLDDLMKIYLEIVNSLKPQFNKSLSKIILSKETLETEKFDKKTAEHAQKIIENILKGTYISDIDGEKLFYDTNKYVKINFASSGQQEVLWILLMIFLLILDEIKTLTVFEEPEAHLYPETQKEIVDLIALLINTADNTVIITTHSPYVLSSVNNLLYAYSLGQINKSQVSQIINERLWLNPQNTQAFFVEKGKIESIIDAETGLIRTEAIDSASRIINQTFDKLFELDNN